MNGFDLPSKPPPSSLTNETLTQRGYIKMSENATQHILRLESQNVKRLKAVEITPDGKMVVVGGANGAGKSSILDSIEYALGGKRHLPKVPIRNGEERGQIVLETEKYTIKRTFTEKGDYIEVKTAEGYKITTPQALLDQLVGDLSFDPLAFTRMEPKKQLQALMNILGLDFSKLDAQYAEIVDKRRDIGRDGSALKARLEAIPADSDAPESELVLADLMSEIEQARQHNSNNDYVRNCLTDAIAQQKGLEHQIEVLEEQLREARNDLEHATNNAIGLKKQVDGLVDADVDSLVTKANEAEDHNKRFRAAQERKALSAQYEQAKESYQKMSEELRKIETAKAEQIAAANFPVDGVSFGEDGILVNGLPFDQASSAEQLRIAVAMGLAANPQLRIILIRDGSLLDDSSLAAVAEMAERYDAQVFVERVGEGQEVSIVIEDGMIKEDRTAHANTEVAA